MITSLASLLVRAKRALALTPAPETETVTTETLAPAGGLLSDDRGVIMIVGVFFTFLWIGLVWFILGIGSAINYHENLQNAADASAFAGAVYDARGMNLIAMINVIMGVTLSILIIAHLVQLISFAFLASDCAQCIPSLGCLYGWADCPNDCSDMSEVNSGVKDVDTAVHDILEVAHYVEVGIAVGWPWVAAGKSTTLVPSTKLVPVAASFAYSQIPWGMDQEISGLTGGLLNLTGSGSNKTISLKNPPRYGLPVANDSYKDLCLVAFMDMTSLYGALPGGLPGKIAGVLNNAGNWFCDAGADSSWPTDVIEGVSDIFSAACLIYNGGDPGFPSLPGDMKNVAGDDYSQSPMKITTQAKMGTDYYGVWSTAVGNYSDKLTPKRVAIAGLESKTGNKVVAALPDDVDMGVTRAEFYYDPQGSPGAPTDHVPNFETVISSSDSVPIHNVMWNMRWRARLRRYHNFPGALGDAASLEAALNNVEAMGVSGLAKLAISELLGGGGVSGLTPETVNVNSEHNEPAKNIYH
jgi:hypothetical protein